MTDGENMLVKTYRRGDSFGELSLMYNAPRAASIIANSPGRLLSLDRSIFSHILKVAALRKQIIIKQAIDKVEILKSIPADKK
jgi:cAMP-dependent protein kinase regulator